MLYCHKVYYLLTLTVCQNKLKFLADHIKAEKSEQNIGEIDSRLSLQNTLKTFNKDWSLCTDEKYLQEKISQKWWTYLKLLFGSQVWVYF